MNLRTCIALLPCLAVLAANAQSTTSVDQEQTPPATSAQDGGAAPDAAPPPSAAAAGAASGDANIEEVVVTATKRKESARTLAGAVTAVTRARLDETGSSNFADYLALSPGVNLKIGRAHV